MVNVNKLKAKMVELGTNVDELSEKIGMDRATFYRRLSANGQTFLIKEADAISKELGMTREEVNEIFFSQFVAQYAKKQERDCMNELVYLKNDEVVCSSLQVAEKFEKRHTHVIERIEKIIENDSTENSAQCFKVSTYKDSTGKSNKMYVMNRDGFTFLVMGFTGKKANEWKWQYIKAFNQMEKFIREKETQAWIDSRKTGKLTRKAETDTIKKLVEYARAQGSQHADKLYMTYSKLANKMAGVSKRDEATVTQLNNLSLMEHIILCAIDSGIVAGKHYKEIYQDCKKRLETVKELAYLEQTAQEYKLKKFKINKAF